MNNGQKNIIRTVIAPLTAATTATTTGVIDTLGAAYVTLRISQNLASATDASAKLAVVSLANGDTTSAYTTVSGAVGTTNATATSAQFVIPANNNTVTGAAIEIGFVPVKRYYQLSVTTAAGATGISASANLSDNEIAPDTATEKGCDVWVKL